MLHYAKQSGVIPYRIQQGKIEVLLITSSRGKRWVIPKGWIKPFKSAADSAAEEAWEETGILGSVLTPAIGSYNRQVLGWPCQVEVFLMQVETELDDWQEADIRTRQWLSVPKTIKRIKPQKLKQLLKTLEKRIIVNG